MNVYLENLRQSPEFRAILDEIKTQRPFVPLFDPDDDNTEVWKSQSGVQKGFDYAMSLFGEKYD